MVVRGFLFAKIVPKMYNLNMENLYPQIKFIYSLPYDRLLNEYENKPFDEKQSREIRKYIKKLQPKWNKVNNSVCRTLEKVVGNKWREKEVNCYVVKHCKYRGISHPLTIKLDPDFDYVFDTLIHELTHILVSYNFKKYKKIETKIKKQFPKENQRTILHIYIIFIELQVFKKLFNQTFINKIIKRGLKFRIKRAFEIVLKEEDNLKKLFEE